VKQSKGLNILKRKANGSFTINIFEVKSMSDKNPIEYTGRVLDQRNNLTGPDDGDRPTYPERPKHVPIQQPANNKVK
jgi:hypothetical protein